MFGGVLRYKYEKGGLSTLDSPHPLKNSCVRHWKLLQARVRAAAVAEWYRYRNVACLVTSSSPVPLNTRRVGQRCTLNLSRAETSSRWCGVVVRRGVCGSGVVCRWCQLRCRPRHSTMVQNDVAKSPRVAEQCDVNIQSINQSIRRVSEY
ncbi:uncharacterized protein TNCV_731501 [Trichonephila clavipes]|nr:uncharacterized protein TNCV_731501 [Trichonephila clavipes]